MARIDIGGDAAFVIVVCSVMLSGTTIFATCQPNRYVDCRKVCAPAAVKIQDGEHGHCECLTGQSDEVHPKTKSPILAPL